MTAHLSVVLIPRSGGNLTGNPDTHIIPIDSDVRPGLSMIKIGMYDLETLDRMAIEGESDNSLTLTEVIIKP